MKKLFLLGAMVCIVALMVSCGKEENYSELIVGKWLPEYVLVEKINENGVCFESEQIESSGHEFVLEFLAEGRLVSYKQGEGIETDHSNRTWHIEGHRLAIGVVDSSVSPDYYIYHDINKLNKKTLDLSSDVVVGNYDSPEVNPDAETWIQRHHTIYKRI